LKAYWNLQEEKFLMIYFHLKNAGAWHTDIGIALFQRCSNSICNFITLFVVENIKKL